MNRVCRRFFRAPAFGVGLLWVAVAAAQPPAAPEPELEITLAVLPPVNQVVEAAMEALPRTLAQHQEWSRRIRLSALLPRLSVGYGQDETGFDRYRWVDTVEQRDGSFRESELTLTDEGSRSSTSLFTDRDVLRDGVGSGSDDSFTTIERIGDGPSRTYVETRDTLNPTFNSSRTTGTDLTSESRNSQGSASSTRNRNRAGSDQTRVTRGPDDLRLDDGKRWLESYSIRLSWDLSQFVFHNDELESALLDKQFEEFRMDITERVMKLYFDLKEAMIYLEEGDVSVKTELLKEFNISMLDALTNGFLTGYAKLKQP